MCTASWLNDGANYELFFNRDETRERAPARPPLLHEAEGVPFLAPIDGDAQGTWLGVNAFGVSVALLNGWIAGEAPRADSSAGFRSRGLLVLDLLPANGLGAVRERVRKQDLGRYRGFNLLVIDPDQKPTAFAWDGARLREGPAEAPTASSSMDGTRARVERTRLLERMCTEPFSSETARLLAFQASHEPERGPWSPCMHRSDASTVSASHVRVGSDQIAFGYAAGPPCRTPWDSPRLLERSPRTPISPFTPGAGSQP